MKIRNLIQNGGGPVPSSRAIDIGTSTLRVAALKRGGRRARLTDYRELSIPREAPGPAPSERVGEKLKELLKGMRVKEEVIVSALPLHLVFIRLLEVPFTKTAQIRQVIASEAELHVPFPLDEVIIDFWKVQELEEGKTRVMMAAVKKSVLEKHLQLLAESGVQPDRVNVDLLGSCRTVMDSSLIEPGKITMFLEIGAAHSGAAFIRGGVVFFVRSISWGGDNITSSLAKVRGLSFAAAEELKISSPREVSPEQLPTAYKPLEVELLRTLPAAAAAAAGRSPDSLVISGGGGRTEGLGQYLAERTGLKLLEIDPSDAARSRRNSSGARSATALGLALSEISDARARLDFRREEFSFSGAWKKLRQRLLITALLTAGVLVLLALGLFWKIGMEQREVRNLNRRIRQVVRLTFPDAPVPIPGQELKVMEEELEKAGQELNYYRELVSTSALDVLREISRAVPESIRVQVVVMDIDANRVIFRGRTNNYRSAELIKNALAQSDYFQGDKIRETRDSKTLQKGGQLVTVEFEYLIPLAAAGGGQPEGEQD